jgi:AcrR family transcriptional regulator
MSAPQAAPDSGLGKKAEQIIAAAHDAFLEQGYDATSMDEVAKRAGVAKQTVYAHYDSKEALFLAVVQRERQRLRGAAPLALTTGALPNRDALRQMCQRFLEDALGLPAISFFRVALAAAYRFPTLGQSMYETGPKEGCADLARLLERVAKAGSLQIDNTQLAAEQLMALMKGDLYFHAMLDPSFRPSQAQIRRHVDATLDCFMARYGMVPADALERQERQVRPAAN